MSRIADLSPTLVEMLYCEALILADEAREAFAPPVPADPAEQDQDLRRIALSCAGLRTTTRIMHGLAWLMNLRAFLRGDLNEGQLRRAGRLPVPPEDSHADAAQRALLPAGAMAMADRAQRFYARVQRLDHAWHVRVAMHGPAPGHAIAVHRMHEWLGQAVASA